MNKNDKSSADENKRERERELNKQWKLKRRISFFAFEFSEKRREKRDNPSSTLSRKTKLYFSKTQNTLLSLIHKAQNATFLFSLVRFVTKQREENKERR